MSATVGLGPQPLHSDGAHHFEPPDVIGLFSARPNSTPTVVWTPAMTPGPLPSFVRHGVFTVRTVIGSFLVTALSASGLRFDPVCMSPGDARARQAVTWFADARSSAEAIEWDAEDKFLLMDNRRSLHARERVADEDLGREIERLSLTWETKEA